MKKLALHFTVAFACTILLCACQTPSPNAEGRAQQKSNAPIPLGDPDVPTHDMCAFSNKRLPATHG